MKSSKNIYIFLAFCVVLYFAGINYVHFTDTNEVFYAQTPKEMLAQKSFLTPVIFEKPQFEKPPLFYWLTMVSFKVFGVNTFAGRFIPILFGLLGVFGTYIFMKKILGEKIAFRAAVFLATTGIYVVYSKAIVTDMVFTALIAFGLYSFYMWYMRRKDSYIALFFLFLSLAFLTKGPLALILSFAAIILFLILRGEYRSILHVTVNRYWLIFLVVGVSWYVYILMKYGRAFYDEFFINDNVRRFFQAEHKNFDNWYSYPAIIIGGLFPWTPYLLISGGGFKRYRKEYLFFISWAATTFIIVTAAHSKLPTYILPVFIPICCMLAMSLNTINIKSKRITAAGILSICLGTGFFVMPPFIKEYYTSSYVFIVIALACVALLMITGGIYLIRRKISRAIAFNVASISLFVFVLAFNIPDGILHAFTDYGMDKVVREYQYEGKPVVCNKMFVRGVHYYTGNPVIVIDSSPTPFWSPHPLAIISKDKEVIDYFKDKDEVLCVIKDSDLERLERVFEGKRKNQVISQNLDRVVVISKKSRL